MYTPQLPALKNGNLMEGLEGHKEDRKASDPAVLCPGTELAEHVGANDSQLFVDERPGHGLGDGLYTTWRQRIPASWKKGV